MTLEGHGEVGLVRLGNALNLDLLHDNLQAVANLDAPPPSGLGIDAALGGGDLHGVAVYEARDVLLPDGEGLLGVVGDTIGSRREGLAAMGAAEAGLAVGSLAVAGDALPLGSAVRTLDSVREAGLLDISILGRQEDVGDEVLHPVHFIGAQFRYLIDDVLVGFTFHILSMSARIVPLKRLLVKQKITFC